MNLFFKQVNYFFFSFSEDPGFCVVNPVLWNLLHWPWIQAACEWQASCKYQLWEAHSTQVLMKLGDSLRCSFHSVVTQKSLCLSQSVRFDLQVHKGLGFFFQSTGCPLQKDYRLLPVAPANPWSHFCLLPQSFRTLPFVTCFLLKSLCVSSCRGSQTHVDLIDLLKSKETLQQLLNC